MSPEPSLVEQVTERNCGTPSLNQTMREAVQIALQSRMDQRAQSRTAPIIIRVFFHIVQVSRLREPTAFVLCKLNVEQSVGVKEGNGTKSFHPCHRMS